MRSVSEFMERTLVFVCLRQAAGLSPWEPRRWNVPEAVTSGRKQSDHGSDSVAGRRRDLARLSGDPNGSEAPPALVSSKSAVAPRERRGSCGNTAAHAKTREALHHARVGTKMRPNGPHRVHPTRTVLQLDGSRGFETPGIRSIGHTARSQTGKRTRGLQRTQPPRLGGYRNHSFGSITRASSPASSTGRQ
ncbi:MAG: hypothetical protein RIT24_1319, partial [Planctomycetota bacterium]|jgi:hypothetical protein